MDVISGILGETEFSYFTKDDFGTFTKVMDDTVANMVIKYMNDQAADKAVVGLIQENIGEVLRIRTLHKQLHAQGIPQLLTTISPETILTAEIDLDDVYKKLKTLDETSADILSYMPARSKDDFLSFKAMVQSVLVRIQQDGNKPTYPEIIKRIEANSFLFYRPNDRGHNTGVGIIGYSTQRWKQCLRGIEYDMYCHDHNISPIARRAF